MSDDQEIHVEDLTTVSKFFSQIPSVIHHMGLGCYIVAYYCLLKAVAEEKKTCFMSQSTISSLLGCSIKQIQLMTNFMEKPFAVLGGKSLIKVTRRKNEKKEKETNVIQIVDIWVENITAMKDRKSIPKTPMKEKKVKDKEKFSTEPGSLPTVPGSLGTVPGTDKEEPFKNTQSKNIYKKDLGLKTEIVHKMNFKNLDAKRRWKLTDQQTETFISLKGLNIQADEGKLAYWSKNFKLDRILAVYHEAKKYNPKSMKSYMSKLLDENKLVPSANAEANREFAREYLESNPWDGAKIFKHYIRYPNGADFGELDFNMDPVDFIYRLIAKHENTQN